MSAQGLGIELRRAMTRAALSQADTAKKAKVPYSWLRQVVNGGMKRPDKDRLRAVCAVLGLDYARALALTDQLGAATEPTPNDELVAAIRSQTEAIADLVAEMRRVRDRDEQRDEALERLVKALSDRPPEQGGASEGRHAPHETAG